MDNRNKDNLGNRTSDSSGHAIGPDTGRKVGEGVGGVSGIVTGAAIGSIGGPAGTVIGAIAGAVGGWWAGKEVSNAATTYTENHDTQYKSHFNSQSSESRGRFGSYDKARPLYQLGHVAAQNPDYRGKNFDQIEPDIKRGWNKDMEQQYGSWNDVRGTVGSAYNTGSNSSDSASNKASDEARLTRSEEELVVGKRQVQAGEVDLRKTVETEHVSKSVPLMHEEIEVERHAISGGASDRNVEIGEQDIRIPLTAEEAVVGKRVVGKEEIVVTKHATEATKNIEADLRKERIDIDKQGRNAGTDSDTNNSDRIDNSSNR